MGTKQYILLGAGVVLVVILALLPKAVVTDNSERVAEGTTATTTEQHSEDDGHDHGSDQSSMAHTSKLPADTQATLDQFKKEFEAADNIKNKREIADKAYDLLLKMNKFDLAGDWKLALYGASNDTKDLRAAADAYYDAYTFAMSEERSAQMATKAQEQYQAVLDKDPKDLDAKVKLGMTYMVSSAPMQGIAKIREVIAIDPNHQLALFNLGLLSIQSGQYNKAIERFKKLKELYPDDMEARFYLAISLKEMGSQDKAIDELKYINKNADSEEIRATAQQYLAEWVN
ncbi:tetratricopeptide repeat protein [Flammeovirga sp. OC4]|uniref:tetratricopeptide repeat protein n=1 Tax=Flammeovirga sp. OC4 TaxID=1382345 RepID=UPI000694FB8F|nr:tetratricopeptide repeat protein [Flammeovirga sp. OC4]